MSFADILYNLFLGPLEVLFEAIYTITYNIIENPGFAIVGLSLVMNLLLLPLYKQTDAIQMEAIETEKRMKPYVAHIKKTFKGNEQFMMLQTCYRQNHYKPTDALKGLSPLVLEIPFFMAAYNFLSGLELLQDASLGPIQNLGAPDGLLVLGGVSINVLPILMTLINVVSSLIYTKDAPLKTKIQLYGMAALFLVLLYGSPAGLAFYWTLNNLFSLVKNALMKTKKPKLVLACCCTACSLMLALFVAVNCIEMGKVKSMEGLLAVVFLNLPLFSVLYHKFTADRQKSPVVITGRNRLSFFLCNLILAVLLGLMIPSALIHTSPEEFIIIGSGINPTRYIAYTALVAAGFFLIWMGLFYILAKPAGKRAMECAGWLLCAVAITDYMWFGKNYGILSSQLAYESVFKNTAGEILLNAAILLAVVICMFIIWLKKPGILRITGGAAALAMICMSLFNVTGSQKIINRKMNQMEPPAEHVESLFRLSKTGKNVVVLMMDRGAGGLVPFIMNEKPFLREQFQGFTYYPNTLSFGSHTNVGLPGLVGGYEYTPMEMNKRDQESLESKHNEALKVLPTIFRDSGFETTVCDPTYAGYDWFPDLSVFSDCPGMDVHITMGKYNGKEEGQQIDSIEVMEHKFLAYSIFKAAPVVLHEYLYDSGSYQNVKRPAKQFSESTLRSYGMNDAFRNSYNVLRRLPDLTEITEEKQNTFLAMCNDTTHSPQLLQLPDYEPLLYVDNSHYEEKDPVRSDGEGNEIVMTTPVQAQHYHCNMASFLEIGQWLEYLKENGVYDNTRIIIAADHGYFLHFFPDLELGDAWDDDIMYYNPLLMVKDFGSTGPIETDNTFMTNADVPTLVTDSLIENPVNPFTGNPINSDPKNAGTLYVSASHNWDVAKNNGNTFIASKWLKVEGDNIKDRKNWTYIQQDQLPHE